MAGGGLVWLLAWLVDVTVVQQLALVGHAGHRHLGPLGTSWPAPWPFPWLFLFFAVPMGEGAGAAHDGIYRHLHGPG